MTHQVLESTYSGYDGSLERTCDSNKDRLGGLHHRLFQTSSRHHRSGRERCHSMTRLGRGRLRWARGLSSVVFVFRRLICYGLLEGPLPLLPQGSPMGKNGWDHWWAATGPVCSSGTMVITDYPRLSGHQTNSRISAPPCLYQLPTASPDAGEWTLEKSTAYRSSDTKASDESPRAHRTKTPMWPVCHFTISDPGDNGSNSHEPAILEIAFLYKTGIHRNASLPPALFPTSPPQSCTK